MSDVATHVGVKLNESSVAQIKKQSGHFRLLIAAALLPLGGLVSVGWIAFLGWTVGQHLNFW